MSLCKPTGREIDDPVFKYTVWWWLEVGFSPHFLFFFCLLFLFTTLDYNFVKVTYCFMVVLLIIML
jgi:hypothetical protein